jgi:hypothetical protein
MENIAKERAAAFWSALPFTPTEFPPEVQPLMADEPYWLRAGVWRQSGWWRRRGLRHWHGWRQHLARRKARARKILQEMEFGQLDSGTITLTAIDQSTSASVTIDAVSLTKFEFGTPIAEE